MSSDNHAASKATVFDPYFERLLLAEQLQTLYFGLR